MLIGAFGQYFFGFTIFVLSSFLVLLVLVQRGRGGGLTGALGGPGGQSAFGTKAGDLFTRITIGVATAWILLCGTAVFMLRGRALPETGGIDRPAIKSEAAGGASSATTGASDNSSVTPKIDLSNLTLPTSGSATAGTAPSATTPAAPSVDSPATSPKDTPAVGSSPAEPSVTAPASDAPATPASETPAPAAGAGSEAPANGGVTGEPK